MPSSNGSPIIFLVWDLSVLSTYADPSLFIRYFRNSITVVVAYVDDIVMTGNDSTYIQYLISQLGMVFEIKILGKLHNFLGIEVTYSPSGLFLSQTTNSNANQSNCESGNYGWTSH